MSEFEEKEKTVESAVESEAAESTTEQVSDAEETAVEQVVSAEEVVEKPADPVVEESEPVERVKTVEPIEEVEQVEPVSETPDVVENVVEEKAEEEVVEHVERPVEQPKPAPKNYGLTFDNVAEFEAHKARILVVGVGGAGNNTITALAERGISGATTIAVNTDVKHLRVTKAHQKVLIGKNLTKGLGAGGYPDVGKNAAMESRKELKELLSNVDLVFVTCGLGGGTGTGAAPVIARFAKESGAIVIAAVTLPFKLEGARILKAEEGLAELRQYCDTVIAIENQRLLDVGRNLPLKKAFAIADDLIANMIKGITETIYEPSLINLDYADVKAIMRYGGVAAIGVGVAEADIDEDRALLAAQKAMNNPLLNVDYNGAKGALIHVTGGYDLKLEEVNRIGNYVQGMLDPNAQVIWGARILPEFQNKVQVITIITGVKSPYLLGPLPKKKESPLSKELGIDVIKKGK